MCASMVDIQSLSLRLGEENKERKKKKKRNHRTKI